ncbi:sigma factor-like helix-turn-helix DNA-binding protein [Paenibacillus abyssi]|uniref:sigma factor-like helix-turn-helix DNA-binding protein n=1 Tax=Paenibacillus abyssi TaxID=1340531 RepID=UPI0036185B43
MFSDEKSICLLKHYGKGCIFCNSADEVSPFKEKMICRNCLTSVRNSYRVKFKPAEAAAEKNKTVMPGQGIAKPRKKRAPRRSAIVLIKEVYDLLTEFPDLTQKELAARLDVSPGRISQIMNMKKPGEGG